MTFGELKTEIENINKGKYKFRFEDKNADEELLKVSVSLSFDDDYRYEVDVRPKTSTFDVWPEFEFSEIEAAASTAKMMYCAISLISTNYTIECVLLEKGTEAYKCAKMVAKAIRGVPHIPEEVKKNLIYVEIEFGRTDEEFRKRLQTLCDLHWQLKKIPADELSTMVRTTTENPSFIAVPWKDNIQDWEKEDFIEQVTGYLDRSSIDIYAYQFFDTYVKLYFSPVDFESEDLVVLKEMTGSADFQRLAPGKNTRMIIQTRKGALGKKDKYNRLGERSKN